MYACVQEELTQLEADLAREEHEVRSVNADIIELREKIQQLKRAKELALQAPRSAEDTASQVEHSAQGTVSVSPLAASSPVRLYAFGALFAVSLAFAIVAYVWLALSTYDPRSPPTWARPS
jgi:hypothetical protein